MTRLRLFVLLARPAVVITMGLFALVGAGQAGGGSLTLLPALAATLGFLVASVAWNDLADVAVDRVNLPGDARRPLAAGRADRRRMVMVALAGTALALLAAASISPLAAGVTLAGLLLSLAYSVPPLRLARRGVLGPLVLPFGFVAVPYLNGFLATGHAVAGRDLALLAGLYLGFVGRIVLKDFRDVKGDALFGKRTFLVRHGRVPTCVTSAAFWVVGSAAVVAARGATPELVVAYAVLSGLAVRLLIMLARCTARREEDSLVASLAVTGRGQLAVILAHFALLDHGVAAWVYAGVLGGAVVLTSLTVAVRRTEAYGEGSNLTTTDLEVGVLDTSATESRGTSTFVSG